MEIIEQVNLFCSNEKPVWMESKEDVSDFLKNEEVKGFVKSTGLNVKSLKPGPVYEACVRNILGDKLSVEKPLVKRRKVCGGIGEVDGVLLQDFTQMKKGVLEIRGYSHLETGTADEKNPSLVDKYILNDDEWLNILLCGKITHLNKYLVENTKEYQKFLNGEETNERNIPKFNYWKSVRFNGFFTFDSQFNN